MTDAPELKPCPCCGGEARYSTKSGMTGRAVKHLWRETRAHCKKGSCGLSTKLCKGNQAKAKAGKLWNTRATPQSAQDYIDIIAAMEIKLERADRVMEAAFDLADDVQSVDQYLTKLQTPGSEPLNSVNASTTRKERGMWTAEVRNGAREQWAALGNAIHKFKEAAK